MERQRPPEKTSDKDAAPPEEDTTIGTTTYSFNPLQAKKDIEAGNFYSKKHDFRAAANRFISATKYNDGDAEAWLRLGEIEERLKDKQAARDAYQKYWISHPTPRQRLKFASGWKSSSETQPAEHAPTVVCGYLPHQFHQAVASKAKPKIHRQAPVDAIDLVLCALRQISLDAVINQISRQYGEQRSPEVGLHRCALAFMNAPTPVGAGKAAPRLVERPDGLWRKERLR